MMKFLFFIFIFFLFITLILAHDVPISHSPRSNCTSPSPSLHRQRASHRLFSHSCALADLAKPGDISRSLCYRPAPNSPPTDDDLPSSLPPPDLSASFCSNTIWGHQFDMAYCWDHPLAHSILRLIQHTALDLRIPASSLHVADFGSGPGLLCLYLRHSDDFASCRSYDSLRGPPLPAARILPIDLAAPQGPPDAEFPAAHWVVALHIGQRIEAAQHAQFLDTVASRAVLGAVFAWAPPVPCNGPFEVACREGAWLIAEMRGRGFVHDPAASAKLASASSYAWNKGIVYVFQHADVEARLGSVLCLPESEHEAPQRAAQHEAPSHQVWMQQIGNFMEDEFMRIASTAAPGDKSAQEDKSAVARESDELSGFFFMILSRYSDVHLRNQIRRTWVADAVKHGAQYRFLLGRNSDLMITKVLKREQEVFNDCVTFEFDDLWENLPLKTLAGHRYVAGASKSHIWTVKIDTDVYLNVARLIELKPTFLNFEFLYGVQMIHQPLSQVPRYREPPGLTLHEYPTYNSGPFNLMSADVSRFIGTLPFSVWEGTRNEDALMGRILEPYHLKWVQATEVHIWMPSQDCTDNYLPPCCYPIADILALHFPSNSVIRHGAFQWMHKLQDEFCWRHLLSNCSITRCDM